MGRQINRVPLDFDWPIGQTWLAYDVGVAFPNCPDCTYGEPQRCAACWHTDHPRGTGWSPRAWELKQSISNKGWDQDRDVKALADAEGWDAYCGRCGGNGNLATDELREWADNMPSTPIPEGDGWQLWETVGDSPMSPVFATADELADWMTTNPWMMNPNLYGESLVTSTRDVAERFIAAGSSFGSFAIIGGQFMDGVAAALTPSMPSAPTPPQGEQ